MIYFIGAICILLNIITLIAVFTKKTKPDNREIIDAVRDINLMSNQSVTNNFTLMEERIKSLENSNDRRLENIRVAMENSLKHIAEDNANQLSEMRKTVDEKLQKTLETKMNESFRLVSERLEEVYKGLGEMKTLASNVGDLKKVMSGVKTRGILGEIQLGAILKEILTVSQYDENVATVPESSNRVEFAVKMPKDGGFVYLPVDAKFPADTYMNLQNAYEEADADKIKACRELLKTTLKSEAKDIHEKYVSPPHTTDFAIMFLPSEGLYSEAVNLGMVEILQKDYKINIAGPSTMAALLNSLQMGFKTLAIQERSMEVWNVLSEVKTEFAKFNDALAKAQERINQAGTELDKLMTTRTNAMNRKLRSVDKLEAPDNFEEE
ncbi:MAG: DNA recombination protein RmuC [Clostridia bacterium]|nr:DNA recombination protein RmuC [Clostridia bacterium]